MKGNDRLLSLLKAERMIMKMSIDLFNSNHKNICIMYIDIYGRLMGSGSHSTRFLFKLAFKKLHSIK